MKRLAAAALGGRISANTRIVFARHRAMPHLLPGRQLSPTHDRIRLDPDAKTFNMFFTNPTPRSRRGRSRAATGACGVARLRDRAGAGFPPFRSRAAVTVTPDALKDYVFAVTIANDISARDVQLPQTQFFKGKSYRGFCPMGHG